MTLHVKCNDMCIKGILDMCIKDILDMCIKGILDMCIRDIISDLTQLTNFVCLCAQNHLLYLCVDVCG